MTVIPAQVAGVKDIRVVSPRPSQEVLAAAAMLGVREFYRVGGAQAIAALAYGTPSIPRVDKIVGPGNAYVTVAKKMVAFECAIDFLAGPTEAVVLSDSGSPDFIAADLVAQAEHDPDALALFITTTRRLARDVALSVERFAQGNPTARESLRQRGAILVAASRKQARDWVNILAPEHITIAQGFTFHPKCRLGFCG
jgi:histidinol dehydrogenase